MNIKYNTILLTLTLLMTTVPSSQADCCPEIFVNNLTSNYHLEIPITSKDNGIQVTSVKEVFKELPSTISEFRELYGQGEELKEPVVFRNAAAGWPNAALTPELLAEKYGEITITVSLDNMRTEDNNIFIFQDRTRTGRIKVSLKDFIKDLTSNPYQATHFVAKSEEFWKLCPEILEGCKLPDTENFPFENNLLIVHKNKITTLHNHKPTFLALFYGIKLVTMVNPIYKDSIYCSTSHEDDPLKCSSLINILNPDLENYPNLKKIVMQQVIIYPGDVLYIPDHWFHHVLSLENSISISRFIGRKRIQE